jgi:hypothetical protein
MKLHRHLLLPLAALALFASAPVLPAQTPPTPATAAKKEAKPFSLTRYQPAIDAYLAADKTKPPPKEAILFIGSSIFRQWTTVTEQMAPLPVFNRAFGGSRTNEVLHYTDTLVLPYAPKLIVYYCGSNDINADVLPATIAANVRAFAERVHATLPHTRIYFTSILRAPQKKDRWDRVDAANALVSDFCSKDARLGYIDLNPAVLGPNGEPRLELYRDDKLHYLPPAYVEFTALIKPVLTRVWAEMNSPQTPQGK